MKAGHFEALRPVCPSCRSAHERDSPLEIAFVVNGDELEILEGALRCTHAECLLEYPIVDGIPILVPDARSYLAGQWFHVLSREDLSPEIGSMIAECSGPGSTLDATRQHLSSYAWDHYGDLDPAESSLEFRPGSLARAVDRALTLLDDGPAAPVLDAGCSVGRATFELARRSTGLTLGVDLNFAMLRLAARVLRTHEVSYERRGIGMVYERRSFPVSFESTERVDFWACDATALPFASGTFGSAVAMNLLDCVASPLDLLRSLGRAVRAGGDLLVGCPYDWSGAASPPEVWIGGHSPRAAGGGSSESVLRALLTRDEHPAALQSLRLVSELGRVPWQVRLHERHVAAYSIHVVHAAVVASAPADR